MSERWHTGTWIATSTGGAFELAAPTPDQVNVRDIAHHLSQLCRFTGASPGHYSVAQHSVLASLHVLSAETEECWEDPILIQRWALLHDADEAYTGDLSRPLKTLLKERAPGVWESIVGPIRAAVMTKFGLPAQEPAAVKVIDRRLCVTEKRDVLRQSLKADDGLEPLHATIKPVCARDAEDMFLRRFQELWP